MPDGDIFDKIQASNTKGDIFDKISAASPEQQSIGMLPKQPEFLKGSVVGNPQAAAATMQPSNLGTIATGPPLMSMQPGLPAPAQVPENATRMEQGAAIGSPIGAGIAGGAAVLPALARGTAGAIGGAYAGGHAGKYLGGLTGIPQLEPILATLGGLSVGGLAAGGKNIPTSKGEMIRMLLGGEKSTAPEWQTPAHTEIPSGSPEYPFSAKLRAGTVMKLPNKLNKVQVKALGGTSKPVVDVTEPTSDPQDLITRMKKLVIPGEQPTAADLKRAGDLTQTPLPILRNLAKFGDKLAQNEMNRRLRLQ